MSLQHLASGKVREIYDLDASHLLMVTTDRMSAFDVVMTELIPDRGRVLTALTEFWLTTIGSDLPHHLVSTDVPDQAADLPDVLGRTMVVRKAEMLSIELIVRGYLAGSGWKEYQEQGTLHGQRLPEGLQLGSKLPQPVLTPSTKGNIGEHDINLTMEEAVDLIGKNLLKEAEELALETYRRGAEWSEPKGLLLADTKFELGFIDGVLSLCDEILTPDSSRYWPTSGWTLGETPPPFDKQILRDWLEQQPWGKVPPPPSLPGDVVEAIRDRYVRAYQRLTSRSLTDWPGVSR